MAWHRKTVEAFLAKQQLPAATIAAIRERMATALGKNDIFMAGVLDEVMGDSDLALEFERAWETDPSIHRAHW
jgi:hypothetical protein